MNFTEGNSRNLISIFLFFHLSGNYVIRIGTRQDRYVSMREFVNHAVLSMSDLTMAVSSKYTQDLSVQIVFFTFSCKWFLCFYFWAVIWSYVVDLFAALHELLRNKYWGIGDSSWARLPAAVREMSPRWTHRRSLINVDGFPYTPYSKMAAILVFFCLLAN